MSEQEQLQWKWRGRINLSARCNIYCSSRVIQDIDVELRHCERLDVFRQSCFGHFLSFDVDTHISGQGLLHLLDREVIVPGANTHERWFRVGDRTLRFSKLEFCMITGLKFGTSTFEHDSPPCEPPNDGIYKRNFEGQAVVAGDLLTRFKNGEFRSRPNDALKLSYILLLTVYLFGMDVRSSVPHWLWSLVEQPTLFDRFPWGSYVFQRLLHYLDNSLQPLSSIKSRPLYHLYGYQIALQIWAFECIPEFGKQLGEKKSDDFPRGIRWRSPGKRPYVPNIFNAHNIEGIQLEPTLTEKERPYMIDIEMDILSGVKFVPQDRPIGRRISHRDGPRLSRSDTVRAKKMGVSGDISQPLKRQKMETQHLVNNGDDWGSPAALPPPPLALRAPPPLLASRPPPPLEKSKDDSQNRHKSKKKLSARATSEFLRTEIASAIEDGTRRAMDIVRQSLPDLVRQSLSDILRDAMPDLIRQLLPEVVRHVRINDSSDHSKETDNSHKKHSLQQTSDFVYEEARFPIVLDQQFQAMPPTGGDMVVPKPLVTPSTVILERHDETGHMPTSLPKDPAPHDEIGDVPSSVSEDPALYDSSLRILATIATTAIVSPPSSFSISLSSSNLES